MSEVQIVPSVLTVPDARWTSLKAGCTPLSLYLRCPEAHPRSTDYPLTPSTTHPQPTRSTRYCGMRTRA
eukprot:8745488-Alexandrium_andersonii.AAC.1